MNDDTDSLRAAISDLWQSAWRIVIFKDRTHWFLWFIYTFVFVPIFPFIALGCVSGYGLFRLHLRYERTHKKL